jgi:alkanesulfonate monooxygenase SsuD/methylene tetrahydromethanopterin reductase-like flavin-dependent oxidoreductase (luciferase family)
MTDLDSGRRQIARTLIGSPQRLRREMLALADTFCADELMILTITGDYSTRRRSYELIADAFELERPEVPAVAA